MNDKVNSEWSILFRKTIQIYELNEFLQTNYLLAKQNLQLTKFHFIKMMSQNKKATNP